jgi:hypothetical protein
MMNGVGIRVTRERLSRGCPTVARLRGSPLNVVRTEL